MRKNYLLITAIVFLFSIVTIQKINGQTPSNDNCSGAIALPLNSTCAYTTYTNVSATASTTPSTPPAPGCGSYSSGDVWFSILIPSNGQVTVDMQAGTMTDSGMAWYTGTCSGLTLLECDDDDSTNGLMSYITRTGLTPGNTIYVRVWGYGNTYGTFGICATTPAPVNDNCTAAIALTLNTTCTYTSYSNSAATASTTPSTPPTPGCGNYSSGDVWFSVVTPANGIVTIDMQTGTMTNSGMAWYTGTCSGLTLLECDDDDSTNGAMSYISRTGLTPGSTIYIRVWGYGNTYGTFGICATSVTPTGCTQGNGTGTTSLGCPSVDSGGLGLNGADPASFNCSAPSTCVDLEAVYLNLGETTSYSVESIPYNPPYQFECLQNPLSVNTDDIWSSVVNLPFDFCFYGNTYSQCLIGSNGVITFDTTNNNPGGYCGWEFSTDLPIAGDGSLIGNAIFGVFHDIDPSVGGEVGWELITLNTGCRALVASWSNVPMYEENSQLYTGMMVLYENTNVIEVYIQEKNIDNLGAGTWNDGNAVVGIQNQAGTIATVAPNRNSLDTNWAITNEAWRFVPDGNSITSIAWHEGSGTSGPIIGTTDQVNVCPSSTTTYTAEVTYQLCGGAVLKELSETTVTIQDSKVWNGSIDTNWTNANNWTPVGTPTASDCVIVPTTANNPIVNGTNYNGEGLNLSVHNSAKLTVTPSNSLTITDWVNINTGGNLEIENNASLIQINNISNSGIMELKRDANIRQYDYVYWSSPVSNYSLTNITSSRRYKWAPTTTTAYTSNFGNWISTSESMVTGKGYIVRAPDSYSTSNQNYTQTFTGTPNNGNVTIPISRSTYNGGSYLGPTTTPVTRDDDNWNLVGNPYPSAIDALDFLTLNTNIAGFVKIWTHGTFPSSSIPAPFYQNYSYNYSLNDYITYNASGSSSGPGVYNGYIAAGQGFFVLMNHTSASTTENLSFNNSMRSSSYDNSQFYKTATTTQIDKNRIWLDLIDTNNNSTRTLVGYITNATNNLDRLYDATAYDKNIFDIYSITENEKLNIQGRQLPYNSDDLVPIGMYLPQNGNYKIAIGALDGLFNDTSKSIYLEDLQTGIIHDLRVTPYDFNSVAGSIDNRFILRYTNTTLDTHDNSFNENEILVIPNENIIIKSLSEPLESVQVFDVLGRKLAHVKNINSNEIVISNLLKNETTLLLQIKSISGAILYKKVIY
ncbi:MULTISPECIES: hypothetical protein [Flavobacterium]|uniref:T9SS-like galactose binding domain-containing protein n=1 Tax=Flavobacterium jumunjinense TaxID=998845 RepID=A0ABV5GSL3_9FLAO|nr:MULTISPECIES: hypothetical protein [Flavobacterium]